MHRANTTFVKIQISFWSETKNTHMPYFLDELRSHPIQNLVWLSPSIMKNSGMIDWLNPFSLLAARWPRSTCAGQYITSCVAPEWHSLCFVLTQRRWGVERKKKEKFKEYVRKMEYCDSELWNCEWGKTLQGLAVETSVVQKSRRETWVRS